MPCRRTQHLNNVPRLRGEKHDISLKILHQAGFEPARQAATSAERHALTIAPCPSRVLMASLRAIQNGNNYLGHCCNFFCKYLEKIAMLIDGHRGQG